MFDKEKRTARLEAASAKMDAHAQASIPRALFNLRQRRARIVDKLALEGMGRITGNFLNDEMEQLARQLVYLEGAIDALSRNDERPGP